MFVWGEGCFGRFDSPYMVKCGKKIDLVDVQVSNKGLAVLINKDGSVYSWGCNDVGQLGLGDYKNREKPTRVK